MQLSFAQRPASSQWEPLPITRLPGLAIWAWYRPQQLPNGVTFMIPAEMVGAYPAGLPFTISDLVFSIGADVSQIQSVALFGGPMQPAAAFFPYLNSPIIGMAPGTPAEISVALAEPIPADAEPGDVRPGFDDANAVAETAESSQVMYQRIESSWKAAVQMERQMAGLRQKLSALVNSLGKLDRELTPEERLSADREDRDAWEDARRWCRDLCGKCHREVKQFDIGMTSAAGKRNWMEQVYQTIIEPRQPCPDLESHRREFETYRKDMTNLMRAMTSAVQAASQNGTQRSQRVLGVIGRKIRERRAKMRDPIGGVNMDKSCRRKK